MFDDAVKEALDGATGASAAADCRSRFRTLLIDVAAATRSRASSSTGRTGSPCGVPRTSSTSNFARWSAAVNVKVPLFDGWRTAGRVAQARAQRNTVTQQIAALENQVRLDVQSAWDALALANRTIQAAELNVTQARRASEMTEANYKLGAATQLDVIDAQQALRQAENIRNQSLYTHANARASLRFVMGRDPLE